jgi:hypothetical protein
MLAALLAACGDGSGGSGPGVADSGGPDGGEDDGAAMIIGCPDPADDTVHYQSMDPTQCPPEQLMCAPMTQFGFNDACGCGCIDKGPLNCMLDPDPHVHLLSGDPAKCQSLMPKCNFNQMPFSNSCGCGCLDV